MTLLRVREKCASKHCIPIMYAQMFYYCVCLSSCLAEVFCIANPSPSASESDGKASFMVTRTGSATDRSCIMYNVSDVSTQGLLLCL